MHSSFHTKVRLFVVERVKYSYALSPFQRKCSTSMETHTLRKMRVHLIVCLLSRQSVWLKTYIKFLDLKFIGTDVDTSNRQTYRISGTMSHKIGSLGHTGEPCFSQIYLYDSYDQAERRGQLFPNLDKKYIKKIGTLTSTFKTSKISLEN